MKVFRIIWILLAVLAVLWPDQMEAQCAMCKATNDGALNEGSGLGINNGIVYLMAVPYVLLAIMGVLFFRKRIKGFFREMSEIHQ